MFLKTKQKDYITIKKRLLSQTLNICVDKIDL